MPAINFSDVKGLEPIPDGVYEGTITYAEEGTSGAGYPKIEIRWKVELPDGTPRLVFDTLAFHPDALWRTKITLRALDFPPDFSGDVTPEDLLGKSAMLTVGLRKGAIDEASGEAYPDRNRVVKVKPLASAVNAGTFIS